MGQQGIVIKKYLGEICVSLEMCCWLVWSNIASIVTEQYFQHFRKCPQSVKSVFICPFVVYDMNADRFGGDQLGVKQNIQKLISHYIHYLDHSISFLYFMWRFHLFHTNTSLEVQFGIVLYKQFIHKSNLVIQHLLLVRLK